MNTNKIIEKLKSLSDVERFNFRRLLETPIIEFDMSVRSINRVKSLNVKKLADLMKLDKNDFFQPQSFDKKSVEKLLVSISEQVPDWAEIGFDYLNFLDEIEKVSIEGALLLIEDLEKQISGLKLYILKLQKNLGS